MNDEDREPATRVDVHVAAATVQPGGEVAGVKINKVDTFILQSYGATDGSTSVQVPPVARHTFFGRTREHRAVADTLRDYGWLLVHGTVGMGKTTLAGAVAVALHQSGVYRGGIVWISEIRNAPLPALCDAIARQLGNGEIPRLPPDAKPGVLRSLLASRPEMLLVLDAFDDSATVEDFLGRCLPPRIALLVTSQTVHPAFDVAVSVGPLGSTEAVQLFEDRARTSAGDPLVKKLCDVVGNHPQAIVLAAGRRRVERIRLDTLLKRLSDEKERLPTLDGADDHGTGLVASLKLAVDGLRPGQRATFLYLSACFGDWTTVEFLARARGISPRDCEDEVGQLARRSLIERDDNGQLMMQRVVRDYGRSRPDVLARFQAVLSAAVQYAVVTLPSPSERYAHLEAELSNLVGGARFATVTSDWGSAISLIDVLAEPVSGVLAVHGHWADLVTLLDLGRQAAASAEDEWRAARFSVAAGIARSRRGERKEARSLYATAFRLFKKLGDRAQQAKVLHNIGKLLQDESQYKAARRSYERSLALREDDPLGAARTLHEIGRLATRLGDFPQARDAFNKSLAVKQASRDRLGIAVTTFNLARLDHVQGDYPRARARYDESRALYHDVEDAAGLALVDHHLGRLAYDQGDLETAARLYTECYKAFDELGSVQELADLVSDRGVLAIERAEYPSADTDLASSIAMKVQLNDVSGRAYSQFEQVRSLRLQGRLDTARQILNEATPVVVRLGDRPATVRADFEAGCLERLVTGDASSVSLFERSLSLAQSLGLRNDIADSLEQLGQIAAARGDAATARRYWGESFALFEQLNRTRAGRVRAAMTTLEQP